MTFIYLHVKVQLSSCIIVIVTAIGAINRVGLMLPPYEAWCSAPKDQVGQCVPQSDYDFPVCFHHFYIKFTKVCGAQNQRAIPNYQSFVS